MVEFIIKLKWEKDGNEGKREGFSLRIPLKAREEVDEFLSMATNNWVEKSY